LEDIKIEATLILVDDMLQLIAVGYKTRRRMLERQRACRYFMLHQHRRKKVEVRHNCILGKM
jgi:hypothetical protein